MTGRMYPEGWAKLSALVIFLGFNLTFFPQFILGYLGMPRRYHAYPDEFQVLNVLSTAGAWSGRRLSDADDLLHLVAAVRQGRRPPIRGAPPAGMADLFAAARPQLRRNAGGHTRATTTRTVMGEEVEVG